VNKNSAVIYAIMLAELKTTPDVKLISFCMQIINYALSEIIQKSAHRCFA